ncbi:MAG: hypothetical protein K2X61_04495 [Caulobacteraceae bacterium]|nr:hypothetical protein [Caulobacteraceae bacterium]
MAGTKGVCRTARLVQDSWPEKRWELHRIEGATDKGVIVGVYATRGAASKVIEKIAYEPDFG